MSNLGMYQAMTTIAKKVGGPVKFIGLVAASGYATGKLLETGVKKVRKKSLITTLYRLKKMKSMRYFLIFSRSDMFASLLI